jgi:thiamine biosynthesis lipoprotein
LTTAAALGSVTFERRAMGSPLRLTVVGTSVADAEAAWSRASDEFEAAEQALSRFRESSDLTALNRTAGSGTALKVGRRLALALAAADRAGRLTCGRFDARILADLERLGYAGAALGRAELDSGRPRDDGTGELGRPWLTIDPATDTVAIANPVDLGGIGKGLALRWAWRRVVRSGLLDAGGGGLLEAGGDIVAGGSAPQPGPWIVAIEDPTGVGEPLAMVGVEDGAVATSSTLVHRWTGADGRPVHHLIDPRTGEPGGIGLLAVTVAGPDPAWAEVWSKSLFLSGADGIAALARARGLAAWWVDDDGRLEMTAAARARTIWVAAEA